MKMSKWEKIQASEQTWQQRTVIVRVIEGTRGYRGRVTYKNGVFVLTTSPYPNYTQAQRAAKLCINEMFKTHIIYK